MAPPSHYVEVFTLLDGGLRDGGWMGEGRPRGGHALAILPGLTHYTICSSPLLAAVTVSFLDEQARRTRSTIPLGPGLTRRASSGLPAVTWSRRCRGRTRRRVRRRGSTSM